MLRRLFAKSKAIWRFVPFITIVMTEFEITFEFASLLTGSAHDSVVSGASKRKKQKFLASCENFRPSVSDF